MMKKKNNTIYTPIWSPQYEVTYKYQWTMFKQPTPILNEKIEFRTFQIIQHFTSKNEKLTKCVANQPGSILLAETSSNSME